MRRVPAGTVHAVFGPIGAGKSTYSEALRLSTGGVCFSIDAWRVELFGPDRPPALDWTWVMPRVRRCEDRIWATASAVADRGVDVVLDMGFVKRADRDRLQQRARAAGLPVRLHAIDADRQTRRSRVSARNAQRGPTYVLQVTADMFDAMDAQYEPATGAELATSLDHGG